MDATVMSSSSYPIHQDPPSSPPASSITSSRQRKPPSVTPKRFSRFFAPRSSTASRSKSGRQSRSARHLRDITNSAANRAATGTRRTPKKALNFEQENAPTSTPKKRKAPTEPESSPIQDSPSRKSQRLMPREDTPVDDLELPQIEEFLPPIHKLRISSPSSHLLHRSFGGFSHWPRRKARLASTTKHYAAGFHSNPSDVQQFSALPFVTATCSTNTLTAVGTEEGAVCLIESAKDLPPTMGRLQLTMWPHGNAIMDLAFSADDRQLATAAGDQTSRIMDVPTQETKHYLKGHTSSLKQVRFQPDNDNIVVTSARDGMVQIWDLRCTGVVSEFHDERTIYSQPASGPVPSAAQIPNSRHRKWSSNVNMLRPYATFASAHSDAKLVRTFHPDSDLDKDEKTSRRRGDVSVTSISFLSSRPHLLLTASEASTAIKLWDIRANHPRRTGPKPLSQTQYPDSHSRHRHFGVNALALSSDDARLYVLSRDNTVYTYATNHLLQGSTVAQTRGVAEAPGPLYGFRHKDLHATSFFVKMSLRKATMCKPELLAVGSSDGTPVLFPTAEPTPAAQNRSSSIPSLSSSPSTPLSFSQRETRMADAIPIYESGTALVGGHGGKEVSSVSWNCEGDLATVSDDYSVRFWREDTDEARRLRVNEDNDGRRWGCGWADCGEEWDEDDG